MSKKGTISVNTTDIFPIIKKWLYSEHDIFIRELISNACDAITKRSTLSRTTGAEIEAGEVKVIIDKSNSTITFKDNGIGMNEEEVEKYIAQLAFSGAEEFVQKMKDAGDDSNEQIIGKFGLGFYSAFMVADKVEVQSLSMNEGSTATKWTCDGSTDYEFSDSDKTEIGTEIILYINEENKNFLESWTTRGTLTNYCDFMPYPIELVDLEANQRILEENLKAEKEEDKKPIPFDIVNDTEPLWKKDPATINDDQYIAFYKKMFPMDPDPLFWIHLNVDHPFTLQGILFFPKLNPNKPAVESNIRLYCKQVFVSDNVKDVIPEFLSLLKGSIDSTDIPLNVSRSALQGDPNVKKISNYIVKKVAESLKKLYKNDREKYEASWEDIGLFVKYGVVSDTKFDDLMRERVLFKNSEEKFMTLGEYKESIPEDYKEKVGDKVVYFDKLASDPSLKKQLLEEKIQTIEVDNYIDPHFMQHTEMQKKENLNCAYVSIDSEFENILGGAEATADDIKIKDFFTGVLVGESEEDKKTLDIEVKSMKNTSSPAYFKVDEQMKRMQQMTKTMGNAAFDFPIKKTLVVNPNNPLIQNAFKLSTDKKELAEKICHHVQDLAIISSEGLKNEEKESFVNRSQEIISELAGLL